MTQALTIAQDQALYEYIAGYLSDGAGDTADSFVVDKLHQAVTRVTAQACSDFIKAWNEAASRSVTRHLPPELFTQCLGHLPLHDLVSATHVCWAWRERAVSDPKLWSSCTIRWHGPASHALRLTVHLERSKQASFTLEIRPRTGSTPNYDLHRSIQGLLRENSARLASYRGPLKVFDNFYWNAVGLPRLASFSDFPGSQDPRTCVPSCLYARHAPCLRMLHLGQISFIGCSPFLTVQTLSLAMSGPDGSPNLLFRYFPSLVSLEIRLLSAQITLPEGPFPASVRSVSIRCGSDSYAIDYTELLAPWRSCRVPALHLAAGASPVPLISMFKNGLDKPPWALNIGSIVRLSAKDTEYSMNLHPRDWHRTWLDDIQPHVSGLRQIQLRPTRFVQFVNSHLELPDLERITLRMEGPVTRDLFDVELVSFADSSWKTVVPVNVERQLAHGPVRVPRLRILDIHVYLCVLWANTEDALRWSTECLPRLLRTWIAYDAAQLERINLVMQRPLVASETSSLANKDFAALASLTDSSQRLMRTKRSPGDHVINPTVASK